MFTSPMPCCKVAALTHLTHLPATGSAFNKCLRLCEGREMRLSCSFSYSRLSRGRNVSEM